MVRKIISRKILTIPEVKQLLEERDKKNELTYTQRITLDYTLKFSKIAVEDAKKLINILISEFGIDEETAYQIVNAMPLTIEELSVFLGGTRLFSEEDLKKIVEKLKQFSATQASDTCSSYLLCSIFLI